MKGQERLRTRVVLAILGTLLFGLLPWSPVQGGTTGQEIGLFADSPAVRVGDETFLLECDPYIKEGAGRLLVPASFFGIAMGLGVEEGSQVAVRGARDTVVMEIGSPRAWVNGLERTLDCPPEMSPTGQVFLPLRFVAEAMGAQVTYTDATGEVGIGDLPEPTLTAGEITYLRALGSWGQRSFQRAEGLFGEALPVLREEGNNRLARLCSEALERSTIFQWMYPYSQTEILELIQETYPDIDPERAFAWIPTLEKEVWDGEEHYSCDAAVNMRYRDFQLIRADEALVGFYHDLVLEMVALAQEAPVHSFAQYQMPVTYRGHHKISIPRDRLPEEGAYTVWLPLPINTGPQTGVVVESVTPRSWVRQPPSIDGDIGLICFEVPLEDLTGDLAIEVIFSYTRNEQRFTVDPQNVGEYDRDSALYMQYTRSYGNTEITQGISDLAREIVGEETNPFLAARLIYDHIVHEIDYAFMPHPLLWPRTDMTESTYVHEHMRGDCGAQSMYFAAMCRSLGIPARTTGGYQLFAGEFGGHFWAEFFLPNYGWIPVDTSCAQIALYPKGLSDEARQAFIDFYFGNLDSKRCVVQKDVDLSLVPPAHSMVFMPAAIQLPTVQYSVPTGQVETEVFIEHWVMECEKLSDSR